MIQSSLHAVRFRPHGQVHSDAPLGMLRRIGFQMSAAATIGCAGDVLQQALEGKASLDDFDVARSARLATYRGLQAPVFDVSWAAFDRWFRHLPGAPGVAAKIVADQILLMPPFVAAFFLSQGAMEGLSFDACVERTRAGFWPTACASCPFWCTMHLITFSVVPPYYRIPWTSFVSVVWNAVVSRQNQLALSASHSADESGGPSGS